MVKDENKERKRRKKKKQHVESYLHITSHPLGSMSPPRTWYYLVAQSEVEGGLRGPYSESLITRSNPPSMTIWGLRNPVGAGDWLSRSSTLRMRVDIFGLQYIPTPWSLVCIAVYFARRLWLACNLGLTNSPRLIECYYRLKYKCRITSQLVMIGVRVFSNFYVLHHPILSSNYPIVRCITNLPLHSWTWRRHTV